MSAQAIPTSISSRTKVASGRLNNTQKVQTPSVQAQAKPAVQAQPAVQMSYEEFVVNAIMKLREIPSKTGKTYRGIHVVYSGFNEALAKYYGFEKAEDRKQRCIEIVNSLVEAGVIEKNYLSLYLPGEAPAGSSKGDAALKAILG